MKYLHPIILATLLVICQNKIYSQYDSSYSNNDLSFGVGTKLNIEFSYKHTPDFKLSLTAGVSYNALIDNNYGISPTVHGGLLFFNKGTIGANQGMRWCQIQTHAFINTTAVFQLDKLDFDPIDRPVPLYHFAEFTANPLQNPFKSSLSYGMNLIWVHEKKLQRVGFFNLNIAGNFQVSYYNDGGPVLSWAGDNRDRYYTGGVILSYHGHINDIVNLVELSYHKFTGYQEYAFDVGEHLQIDFVNYFDTEQFKYNQQRWRLNFTNLDHGFGGSISIYNSNRLDFQDFLHFTTNVPYHPDYDEEHRWMFGGRYEYNNSKL